MCELFFFLHRNRFFFCQRERAEQTRAAQHFCAFVVPRFFLFLGRYLFRHGIEANYNSNIVYALGLQRLSQHIMFDSKDKFNAGRVIYVKDGWWTGGECVSI